MNADGETCTLNGIGDVRRHEFVLPKEIDGYIVSAIGEYAFYSSHIGIMCYGGTESDWANVSVDSRGNASLKNAEIYYYSETEPEASGNYWHYVDGVPMIW